MLQGGWSIRLTSLLGLAIWLSHQSLPQAVPWCVAWIKGARKFWKQLEAKRTCRGRRSCIDWSRMTHSRHERASFGALHGPDLL